MSRPVFLVALADLADAATGGVVSIGGSEGHHGVAVRRLTVGEEVEVVDGAGRRATGIVVGTAPAGFELDVSSVVDEPGPRLRVTVVQALAKGDRSELAVEMLTEVGVDRLVPWAAERSIAVWRGDRAERGLRRWRSVAAAATKQSRRSWLPEIQAPASTADVTELLSRATLGLVLHEAAAARLSRVAVPDEGSVVLVVGPEGGISDPELASFTAAGGLSVRMGESVLRTSTAGVAAASVVMASSGRWN